MDYEFQFYETYTAMKTCPYSNPVSAWMTQDELSHLGEPSYGHDEPAELELPREIARLVPDLLSKDVPLETSQREFFRNRSRKKEG